ncbi:hypothetical protein [Sphingopyxis flava]|uniref:Apea-like HEPN domain-containing protein n=1 Tax=Sphingopyxis flava TaxID=1507287 RepID=A0A1T5G2Q2_9SPHN|nr:hypothetical protein [Sphingopyxis flava]SKC02554.1 hypothetical protein SAMN06295937_10538 [Sphingopyxis flava]
MTGDRWFQTDESDDVAGSLRHALRCLPLIDKDPQVWKWFALALHSTLQGACVCHLVSTATPIGAVYPENAAKFISFFEESRANPDAKPPEARLMALPGLLKAARKPHSAGDRSNDQGIAISDAELEWLNRFHASVRNQFTHFEPMGWSLEVSGFPEIAMLVARIVSEIADTGWAFRHKDREWISELKANLGRLEAMATNTN